MIILDNILKFIKIRGISVRQFEKEIGASNGTLNNTAKRNADLSQDLIKAIVDKYSTELAETGFEVFDLAQIGLEGLAIRDANYKELGGMKKENEVRQTVPDRVTSVTLENLAESNRIMAEANKIQAEANRIQAESNRQLVESNRELTAIIKASTTAGAGPEIPAAVAAKFEDLLAVVAEVVGGKRDYKSRNEAFAEIHRLFYDSGKDVQHVDTQIGEGI